MVLDGEKIFSEKFNEKNRKKQLINREKLKIRLLIIMIVIISFAILVFSWWFFEVYILDRDFPPTPPPRPEVYLLWGE